MSSFISGKDLLTRLDILPFELFNHVKNGLQPFDEFGKPIPPPDISSKLKQLEELKKEWKNFLRYWPEIPASIEKVKELFEKNLEYLSYATNEQKRLTPRREWLLNNIEALKKEIEQIEDKDSWKNYELSENKQSAEWVIDLLLRSYFNLKDVASIDPNFKREFISGSKILTKWSTEKYILMDLIRKGLQPWHPIYLKPIRRGIISESPLNIPADLVGKVQCKPRGGEVITTQHQTLPREVYDIEEIYSFLEECLFLEKDTEAIERANPGLCQKINEEPKRLTSETVPEQKTKANYFKRNGEFWILQHEGKKSTPIKHVDGLLYIAHLLSKPGTSISCKDLYQFVSGNTPDKIMSESAAIGEGLNIGSSTQAVKDKTAQQAYAKKYRELQNSHDAAESNLEQHEIEKEMDKLLPYLKEKTFVKPDDKKAQVNIKKRLDKAYETISKKNMKDMAKYLQNNIKPDGALGLIYTGTLTWEIIIE